MKDKPLRRRRMSFKEFLRCVPKLDERDMRDKYPERRPDDCTEIVIYHGRLERKKKEYFERHKFYYLLAKLLNRKEVK